MFYLTLNLQAKTLLLRGFKKFFRINSLLLVLEQNALLELAIDFEAASFEVCLHTTNYFLIASCQYMTEVTEIVQFSLNSIEYKESKQREMVAG